MAKRFTDNNKWKKRFFKELPIQYKLLWIYILDDCDHAGIWDVDLDIAEMRIGDGDGKFSFLKNECEEIFEGQIVVLDKHNHKWFIPDFITFQYGSLNPNSRVHQSVIQILQKYNLYEPAKDLEYIEVKEVKKFKKPCWEEVAHYCGERMNNVDAKAFVDFYESKGWLVGKNKMKDWKAAVRTWEKNNFDKLKTNKIDKNLKTWQNVKNVLNR